MACLTQFRNVRWHRTERILDGVEFDVGDRMEQRGQALGLERRALRHPCRVDEFGPIRPAGNRRRGCRSVLLDRQRRCRLRRGQHGGDLFTWVRDAERLQRPLA